MFCIYIYYWNTPFSSLVMLFHFSMCLSADVRVLNEYPQIQSFTAFSNIYDRTGIFGIQATTVSCCQGPSKHNLCVGNSSHSFPKICEYCVAIILYEG